MKRPLVLAAVILLVGGVLYEEKHRAATIRHHIVAPELSYEELEAQSLATNESFSDNINLWDNPRIKAAEAGLNNTGAAFQKNLVQASLEKMQSAPGEETEPAFTVLDRELTYAIFAKRDFTLTLNLKPAYSSPSALMPSHLNPGIGGSFSF